MTTTIRPARQPFHRLNTNTLMDADKQFILVQQAMVPQSTKTVSGAYTATINDQTILADATSAGFTVTLPRVSNSAFFVLTVKKIDSSGHTVTLSAVDGALIDGSSTLTLSAQYKSRTVQSDGAAYWIVGGFG